MRYTVTHSCGHAAEHKLTGPQRYREYKLRKLAEGRCPTCQAEERERQLAEAARRNREEGLPPLVGTEAQVAWAEHIRREALDGLAKFIHDEEFGEAVAACLDYLMKETRASWWINYRVLRSLNFPNAGRADLYHAIHVLTMGGVLRKAEQQPEPPPESVKAEATVQPANPKTKTVAAVEFKGSTIEVRFPEVREDFRKLIRFELGYSWTGSCWRRTVTDVAGPVEERVVETAHRLLAAGFPIRLYDDELRRRAIEADFTPEPKRIIWKQTSGQYAGWFGLGWARDEDYYNAARKLPGARWDRDSRRVVVPAEQWEAVIGFAETYDFTLSSGAQALVDQARAAQEAALVAPPMEPKRAPKGRKPSQTPPKLEVPVEVDIDDGLRDDDD